MANEKISQMPAVSEPLDGSEAAPVVQGGLNRSVSVDSLLSMGKRVNGVLVTNGAGKPSISSTLPDNIDLGSAAALAMNGWSINSKGQTFYIEGTSVSRGGGNALNSTISVSVGSPCAVTWNGVNGLGASIATPAEGATVVFEVTGGSLPTGISADTVYYARNVSAGIFNLSATPSGSLINTTGSSTGTQYGYVALPHGGVTGNFFDLLCNSIWGSGKITGYNDSVSGSTTTQMLARYTTGNSSYGVVVPSAHSLSPIQNPADTGRHYYFIECNGYGDFTNSIPYATSIANLTALSQAASADGWTVILLTSTVSDRSSTSITLQYQINQAARNGTIPADFVIDMALCLQLQTTPFYYDTHHFTPYGHILISRALTAHFISGGDSSPRHAGPYFNEPMTAHNGFRADNEPGSAPITINSFISGARLISLTQAYAAHSADVDLFTSATDGGAIAQHFSMGLGGPSDNASIANKWFIKDFVGGLVPFTIDAGTGNITLLSALVSSGVNGGLGYTTGAGGNTSQITDKTTAVTINKPSGTITLAAGNLVAGATVSFTLNNSAIGDATDYILIQHISGGSVGSYLVQGVATGAGTATISVTNIAAGALNEQPALKYIVLKAATS